MKQHSHYVWMTNNRLNKGDGTDRDTTISCKLLCSSFSAAVNAAWLKAITMLANSLQSKMWAITHLSSVYSVYFRQTMSGSTQRWNIGCRRNWCRDKTSISALNHLLQLWDNRNEDNNKVIKLGFRKTISHGAHLHRCIKERNTWFSLLNLLRLFIFSISWPMPSCPSFSSLWYCWILEAIFFNIFFF